MGGDDRGAPSPRAKGSHGGMGGARTMGLVSDRTYEIPIFYHQGKRAAYVIEGQIDNRLSPLI
jgi:hypothetical protein